MEKEITTYLFIGLFLVFVLGFSFIGEAQRDDVEKEVLIMNVTYEPLHIYGEPIKKNLTTKMIIEEKVKIFNFLVFPEIVLINNILN